VIAKGKFFSLGNKIGVRPYAYNRLIDGYERLETICHRRNFSKRTCARTIQACEMVIRFSLSLIHSLFLCCRKVYFATRDPSRSGEC